MHRPWIGSKTMRLQRAADRKQSDDDQDPGEHGNPEEGLRHPELRLKIPAQVFCMSWCADFEFRVTHRLVVAELAFAHLLEAWADDAGVGQDSVQGHPEPDVDAVSKQVDLASAGTQNPEPRPRTQVAHRWAAATGMADCSCGRMDLAAGGRLAAASIRPKHSPLRGRAVVARDQLVHEHRHHTQDQPKNAERRVQELGEIFHEPRRIGVCRTAGTHINMVAFECRGGMHSQSFEP